MVATHYQRLGVEPSASTEEIRAAYRQLARRLHPDRLGDTTGPERVHAERRMREINESWEVLRDAGRRRRYDEGRLQGPRRPAAATPAPAGPGRAVAPVDDDDLVDVLPEMGRLGAGAMRHGPWLVLVLVLGLIFVGTAYAGGGSDEPAPPQRAGADVVPGSCIDTGPGTVVDVVPCSGPHELEVVGVAATAEGCPPDSEPRRFSNAGAWDCVVSG